MFHANQGLLLLLAGVIVSLVGGIIPIVGWFLIAPLGSIFILVLFIMGLVNALQGENETTTSYWQIWSDQSRRGSSYGKSTRQLNRRWAYSKHPIKKATKDYHNNLSYRNSPTRTQHYQDNRRKFVATKVINAGIEKLTDGKINIDTNTGETTIKSEDGDGSVRAGSNVKIPSDFPSDIVPIFSGATVVSSVETPRTVANYTQLACQSRVIIKKLSISIRTYSTTTAGLFRWPIAPTAWLY